jgi:PAS domain S-box-containing protein
MADAGKARKRDCPLLDHSPLIVLEIARDGTILYANRTLSGEPVEDVLGRCAHDLLPESARPLSKRQLEEAFREDRTVWFEVRDVVLAGKLYAVRIYLSPIGEEGETSTASVIVEDITERESLRDAVRWRLDGEELLVSIAGEMIDLPIEEVDGAVMNALRRVGVFAGTDRIAIFSLSDDGSKFSHSHAWGRDGEAEVFAGPTGIATDKIPWIVRRILADEVVLIESPETLPPEADAERAWLDQIRMRSFVGVPIVSDGKVRGFLGALIRETPRVPLANLPIVLRSLAIISGSALRRKAATAEARRTEERFRAVVEQSLVGIALFGGLPPRLIIANQAACDILGYTHEELAETVAHDTGRLIPPEDREAILSRYVARLAGATPSPQSIIRIVRKEGSIRWIEVFSAFLEHGGEPTVQIVFVDRTAHQEAEEELRRSEERYRLLAESAQESIFVLDEEMRFRYANPAAEVMAGMDLDHLIGLSLREIVPLETALERERNTRAVMETGEPREFLSEIGLKDRTIVLATTLVPLPAAPGEPRTVLGISRDVTEENRAAAELRKSEAKYRTLAETSHDFIFVIDPDIRVAYVNSTAARFIGRSPEEITGKPLDELFPQRYAVPFREATLTVYRTGEPWVSERLFEAATGTIWMTTTLTPIRNEDGTVRAVLGVSRDLTERKKMEDELRRHRDKLEALVLERTERVRSLERQQAEVERLASTGRMAARIAHEINNPLAAVRNSFLLAKDAIPEEHPYAHYVPIILKEIDRISFVIRQMSTLHPTENEPSTLFSVSVCVRDITALLRPMCEKRRVRLEIDLDEGRIPFYMSEGLLRQVLYNLILNAIEASPSEGTVVTRVWQRDGEALRIEVKDEGPGIPEEHRARLYEPFFTTKALGETGGLGLGLPNVRAIVEAMDGTIDFECPPSGGTRFRVEIPIHGEGS